MDFRKRLQWISRMALLLFILASVAFLSALVAMRFAIQGRDVSMPDVVGKKVGASATDPSGQPSRHPRGRPRV